jgi:hypothetical protein
MKFRKTGRWLAASIISLSAALALTSCGSDFTVGFLFVPLAQIDSMGGGGVNVFRIKHNFGNLTLMNPTPISSGGPNAVKAIITGSGRLLYVVNQGAAPGATSAVELFSVGGGGVLTPQQGYGTQGTSPIDLTTDSSGAHLYVVDQIAPGGAPCPNGMTQPAGATAANSLCGGNNGVRNRLHDRAPHAHSESKSDRRERNATDLFPGRQEPHQNRSGGRISVDPRSGGQHCFPIPGRRDRAADTYADRPSKYGWNESVRHRLFWHERVHH